MHISVRFSSAIPIHRGLVAAIVLGIPLVLPGCGIPPLRGPDPGQQLPGRFEDANNLNYYRLPPAPEYYMREDADAGSFSKGFLASVSKTSLWGGRKDAKQPKVGTAVVAGYATSASGGDSADAAHSGDEPSNLDGKAVRLAVALDGADDPAPQSNDGSAPSPLNLGGAGNGPGEPGGGAVLPPVGPMRLDNGSTGSDNSSFTPFSTFFNDPILQGLIQQALAGNQELKILTQEIQVANFEVMKRRGTYLPFVTLGGGIGLDKPSKFTPMGAVEDQLPVLPHSSFPDPLPDFLAAANVSWEIDIWRKLRNARDAATMRWLGTADGQNYVVTRLIAEIAENYYELLALDNRLVILDQTIAIQQKSLELAEAKKAAGTDTELPVQRFRAEVRKNQSQKQIVHQQVIEVENRINFLLGRYPQHVERQSANYIDLTLPALNLGVPSQLLRNRADVRQAERELAAAGLDVRVARAQFYPSLVLTGGLGLQAFNPKYLFNTPESLIYNVAGELVGPLINKKAIRADYLTANAMQLEAVYKYQRTILNAFTEVINRMAKAENYGQSIEIKKQQLASLEASVNTATSLFEQAQAEYVDVLLAQRDLMEARTVLVETKQQQLAAIVNAYQAVGGGGMQMFYQQ